MGDFLNDYEYFPDYDDFGFEAFYRHYPEHSDKSLAIREQWERAAEIRKRYPVVFGEKGCSGGKARGVELEVYCDGSGTHHEDSPACVGVVLMFKGKPIFEYSAHEGQGTNNVAELLAVSKALFYIRDFEWEGSAGYDTPAVIRTDSEYAIGSVTGAFSPKVNVELVRKLAAEFEHYPNVRFEHVKGHAGNLGNELADWLAGEARRGVLEKRGSDVSKKKPRPGEAKPSKQSVLTPTSELEPVTVRERAELCIKLGEALGLIMFHVPGVERAGVDDETIGPSLPHWTFAGMYPHQALDRKGLECPVISDSRTPDEVLLIMCKAAHVRVNPGLARRVAAEGSEHRDKERLDVRGQNSWGNSWGTSC